MYTYAPNQLEEESDMRNDGCCTGVKMESLHRKNSSVRGRGSSRLDTISFSKRVGLPREKVQPCGLNSISVVGLHLLLLYKFHGDCKLLKSCLPFPESHCNEDWYAKCHMFFAWTCSRSPKGYTSGGRWSQLPILSDIFCFLGLLKMIVVFWLLSQPKPMNLHVIGAIMPAFLPWFGLNPT